MPSLEALAAAFGGTVWAPTYWPTQEEPDLDILKGPGAVSYELVSTNDAGALVVVHGYRRPPGTAHPGEVPVDGTPFETLAGPGHVLVKCPDVDVHITGSCSDDELLACAASLTPTEPDSAS
jgi:hypothetical protein